ncbi:hypothetical protein BGZ82_007892 [Podila clonocystis]|nr:hypothetical protein BGZ82_007892 [Podila clonocystis]
MTAGMVSHQHPQHPKSNSIPIPTNSTLQVPSSPLGSSFNSDSSFLGGSRRSSKDSSDSTPGVTLDDLLDQLTIPDYVNTIEQIARTKVFFMIYRKFLRPRELLEMFIGRFEELKEFAGDEDDEEARNTRLRICACLYYWLKNHPNDLIHRQTRQRVASFLRERVGLYPCLNEIYVKLLPLSSIHYFNSWRWPHGDHFSDSRNSSFSGPTLSGSISDEDSDSGFSEAATPTEQDMDEDREWGLFDEDETLPEAKSNLTMDSLTPSPKVSGHLRHQTGLPLPRDRRSSTGSLAHQSPCAMETFVATRRGSASSVNSSSQNQTSPSISHTNHSSMTCNGSASFPEGDATPQQLQPLVTIPFINKRSSSQAYRQKIAHTSVLTTPPTLQPNPHPPPPHVLTQSYSAHPTSTNPTLVFKDNTDDSVHPFQGKASPLLPAPIDYLSVNTPFIEIKDGAIAAQLTCVEFGLFRKLKPRDMLRQVWKTNRGSAAFQACIAHFNFISSWVGTMILSPPKVKHRAKMMEKFISIAKILRDMGNFNTTMAIIGAMNTSSIHRLVQTRELLQGKEIWTTFKELEHLMGSERSFHEYRNALKTAKLPCIPYLGVHLGDLLSISEGNRDFRQDGNIHWQKFCLLTEVISTVMHFQSEPYKIQPDPFISRVITDTHVLDDEELYTKSVGTEPGKLHHSRSLSKFNFF